MSPFCRRADHKFPLSAMEYLLPLFFSEMQSHKELRPLNGVIGADSILKEKEADAIGKFPMLPDENA